MVETILPAPGDVINGETQLAFKVTDNGKVVNGFYVLPPMTEKDNQLSQELELKSLVPIFVGRENAPIQNEMYFTFEDASGNVKKYTEKT